MHFSIILLGILTAAPIDQTVNKPYYYKPPTFTIVPLNKNDIEPASADFISSITTPDKVKTAVDFMMSNLKITDPTSFRRTDILGSSSGTLHCHMYPVIDGLRVANAQSTVNVNINNKVISISSSWIDTPRLAKRAVTKTLSPSDAVVAFAQRMGYTVDRSKLIETPGLRGGEIIVTGASFTTEKITTSLKYYQTATTLEKVVEISAPVGLKWHNAFISVEDQQIVGLADFSTDMFYNPDVVAQFEKEEVEDSNFEKREPVQYSSTTIEEKLSSGEKLVKRQKAGIPAVVPGTGVYKYKVVAMNSSDAGAGLVVLTNPADIIASPIGWHNSGAGDLPTTIGNNVFAQQNTQSASRDAVITSGIRPQNSKYEFVFPDISPDSEAPSTYGLLSTTNLFVLNNLFHDLLYRYDFNEQNGNFQTNNFDKGGEGNDAVVANSQDGSGTNNANFATPPDGRQPLMRMYLYNGKRDGSLDNTIVAHEYFHGVSNRLTGGPSNSRCLNQKEGGGMGEGWSDFFALILIIKNNQTRQQDVALGTYSTQRPNGVRKFKYSTKEATNPRTYTDLTNIETMGVHSIGEVWALMLFEVMWNMIDRNGFSSDLKNASSGRGNTEFLQLVLDGLKLQPCNPTFIQARDAILLADQQRGEQHKCEIQKGFAKRGLGLTAKDDGKYVNSMIAPNCTSTVRLDGANPRPRTPAVVQPGSVEKDENDLSDRRGLIIQSSVLEEIFILLDIKL